MRTTLSLEFRRHRLAALLTVLMVCGGLLPHVFVVPSTPGTDAAYIVQAASADIAAAAVESAGGVVTRELAIIDGVAALLSSSAAARLDAQRHIALQPDKAVRSAQDDDWYNDDWETTVSSNVALHPSLATRAHLLHEEIVPTVYNYCDYYDQRVEASPFTTPELLRGWGVTVAVVDSGLIEMDNHWRWDMVHDEPGTLFAEGGDRCFIYRDFIYEPPADMQDWNDDDRHDTNGHGTHVASTIVDDNFVPISNQGDFASVGVAPDVNMLIARALGEDGSGTYSGVIEAIQWIVDNRERYNIGVMNLSIYAPVTSFYWEDPLNQAVMRAWQEGIVVVAAAGNEGPEAGTITVPGNVPYVITVGALQSGHYTDSQRDELADFSSRGPTEAAFIKPDVVVPATRTIAPMPEDGYLSELVQDRQLNIGPYADYHFLYPVWNHAYYELSGTSMAAAQVSGVVALMLQANPDLTNDQVKYRLLATARPAIEEATNEPAYTVWEQGAGLLDTHAAVFTTTLESANEGMDIALDLDPTSNEHYWGNTVWDEALGEFQIIDLDTGEPFHIWAGGRRASSSGFLLWAGGRRASSSSTLWAGGRRASSSSTLFGPYDTPGGQLQSADAVGIEVVIDDIETPVPEQERSRIWLPMTVR